MPYIIPNTTAAPQTVSAAPSLGRHGEKMEKSRKREAFEAIALVAWTMFFGGAGIVLERYHTNGELATAAAALSVVKSEAEISKIDLVAAQEGREAARWRMMESEQL